MNLIKKLLNGIWELIKKFWWLILLVIATIFGIKMLKLKNYNRKLESMKKRVIKRQEQLEKDLEKLKKEAEKIEKTRNFDNPDDAVNFINDLLRRLSNNSKK